MTFEYAFNEFLEEYNSQEATGTEMIILRTAFTAGWRASGGGI